MNTDVKYFIGVDPIWRRGTPILIRVIPNAEYPQAYRWVNASVRKLEPLRYEHTKKLVWIDINYRKGDLTPITTEEAKRHMLMEELS